MPIKGGKLTDQEARFIEVYARTNDGRYSAEKAGYRSPVSRASQTLNKPAIAERVEAARTRLRTDGLEIGVGVLIELAQDRKCPPGVRRAAASDLIKFSGLAGVGEADELDPGKMTLEDLDRIRQRLARELAETVEPIEAASVDGLFD
jgi:hypothetical protein